MGEEEERRTIEQFNETYGPDSDSRSILLAAAWGFEPISSTANGRCPETIRAALHSLGLVVGQWIEEARSLEDQSQTLPLTDSEISAELLRGLWVCVSFTRLGRRLADPEEPLAGT